MIILRTTLLLALALPLAADPVADVRAALGKLTAKQSIRASYELQRSVDSSGKLGNDAFSGKVVVELEGEGGDFRLVVPRPLLEQIAREQEANAIDVERKSPTVSALSQLEPGEASNAIDFAPNLLRMLHGAKLLTDLPGTFQGKPVRVLVLKLADRIEKDDAGKIKVSENKLTLWLGSDLVPVGAEHLFQAKFSFLVFKGVMKNKKSWYLTQVGDRLVRVRHESSEEGSGLGQKQKETLLAIVRVH